MNDKGKIAVIIPSLDPDDKLLKFVVNLKNSNFKDIIIVNDGSGAEYLSYFKTAELKYGCEIITHSVNLGKGRALKSAFNYILTQRPDIDAVVTVDSDGQHEVDDVEKCAREVYNAPNTLVLGCRNFSFENKTIPFRSKFGNVLTRNVLRLLCGIKLSDTQTGLRGISRDIMRKFMIVNGERFEYEMNMILVTKELNIPIKKVPIKTIYIENNKTSHFHPLLDSLRIYLLLFKFLFSSLASFLVDIIVFTTLVSVLSNKLSTYIVVSEYSAKAISAILNYVINKKRVFKNKDSYCSTLGKYALLWLLQTTISAFAISALFELTHINAVVIKIVVGIILFFLTFRFQREWVFKSKEHVKSE